MSNDTTAAPEAQSPAPAQPTAGAAEQAAPENSPSLSHEEHLDSLSPENLEAATRLLSPDRQRSAEGVDGGEPAPQAQGTPPPAPAAPPAPPDPDEGKAGRIRIDRLSDARTRSVVEFLSRNHDATYEDALAATEPPKPAAPTPAPAGPDLNALNTRVTDLAKALKAAADPMADNYDADKAADLRDQLEEARLDVRFAKRDAEQRAAGVQTQRAVNRQESVARAVEMCPEINDPASPQGREFTRLYAQYQAANAALLHDDDCAETITARVMVATGYVRPPADSPAAAAATPPSTPSASAAAPPAPRAPIPVVRNTPPASVSAPGSARVAQPAAVSSADFLKAIDDSDDVSGLIAAMTPSANNVRKKFSFE